MRDAFFILSVMLLCVYESSLVVTVRTRTVSCSSDH